MLIHRADVILFDFTHKTVHAEILSHKQLRQTELFTVKGTQLITHTLKSCLPVLN